jgi:hypothetical protein
VTSALAIALALSLAAAPAAVESAVAAAAQGVRPEVLDWRPALASGCAARRYEALRQVRASGEVPVRIDGTDARGAACEGWGWARVRAWGPALVTARAVRSGEPLAPAVALGEAEISPGKPPVSTLPDGAVAARDLPAGARLQPGAVRGGPPPGSPVTVLVRTGAITVARPGRAVPCPPGRACALLPSGRRVEGRLEDGLVVVEAP